MTDTEILDWIQQNVTEIREDFNDRMTVTWLDKTGIPCETEGDNLRDCIREAAIDSRSRKDAQPVRTLGDLLREAESTEVVVPNAKFTGAEGVRCNARLDAAPAKEKE